MAEKASRSHEDLDDIFSLHKIFHPERVDRADVEFGHLVERLGGEASQGLLSSPVSIGVQKGPPIGV